MSRSDGACDRCGCVLECPICVPEDDLAGKAVQAERARCVELWKSRASFTKPHLLAALKAGLTVAELRAGLRDGLKP